MDYREGKPSQRRTGAYHPAQFHSFLGGIRPRFILTEDEETTLGGHEDSETRSQYLRSLGFGLVVEHPDLNHDHLDNAGLVGTDEKHIAGARDVVRGYKDGEKVRDALHDIGHAAMQYGQEPVDLIANSINTGANA